MKFLPPCALLLAAMPVFGQTPPSVSSFEIDTTCEGVWGDVAVYDLVVTDIDGDSTSILVTGFDPTLYTGSIIYQEPCYPCGTTRTFQIQMHGAFGVPVGITQSDIDVIVEGNLIADGSGTPHTFIDVGMSSAPVVDGSLFDATQFCQDEFVDLRPLFSPLGGTFQYGTADDPYMFDVSAYYATGGETFAYVVKNAAGCLGYANNLPSILDKPIIDLTFNPSTCGNADGDANADIIGGLAPYDCYWSTGFSESTSSATYVSGLTAGAYYLNVVDAQGCRAVQSAYISDTDLTFGTSITDQSCIYETSDGAIDITASSGTGTITSYFWSTGASSEDISGLGKGEYTVQIHTDNGCHGYYLVNVGAPAKLEVGVYSLNGSCLSASAGLVDITMYGGTAPYAYFWNTLATTEDISSLYPGFYTCAITDANGCAVTARSTVFASDGPSAWLNETVSGNCGASDGSIDVSVAGGLAPVTSVVWNGSIVAEDLVGANPGWHTCVVTDGNGCDAEIHWKIPGSAPVQPEICLLTVDTGLVYNEIVWTKEDYLGVDGFRIYRETSTYGEFELIADKAYAELSSFQDNEASPIDRSWRYVISTYDACGFESFGSYKHKTIHVIANTSDMVDYDLSWDHYEGINYTDVILERYDDISGWQVIATLPYGTTTYPDTPPVIAGLDYMVSFDLAVPCTSSKASGIDYNSSRSNTSGGLFNPGGSTSQIADPQIGNTYVFPNPVNDQLTIRMDKPEEFSFIEVCDINGRTIQTVQIPGNVFTIDMNNYRSGVYYVRFMAEQKPVVHKIVKK